MKKPTKKMMDVFVNLYEHNGERDSITDMKDETGMPYAHIYDIIMEFEEEDIVITGKFNNDRDRVVKLTDYGKRIAKKVNDLMEVIENE